tara:strand:+ start:330 stop:773 length:444 start_codon:yes stop_codon:yes gene_type:complete
LFSQEGSRLILCGRRQAHLERIKKELDIDFLILCFDVTNRKSVKNNIESIPEAFLPIYFLINNAGNAHDLDSIVNANIQDWDQMIDVNVKGLLYVTKYLIPNFTFQKKGTIINLGSISALEFYPNGGCLLRKQTMLLTPLRKDLELI